MSNEPTDKATLERAGQLPLFSHVEKYLEGKKSRLEELVDEECRNQLEEQLYRERILAWHPEFDAQDLEGGEE